MKDGQWLEQAVASCHSGCTAVRVSHRMYSRELAHMDLRSIKWREEHDCPGVTARGSCCCSGCLCSRDQGTDRSSRLRRTCCLPFCQSSMPRGGRWRIAPYWHRLIAMCLDLARRRWWGRAVLINRRPDQLTGRRGGPGPEGSSRGVLGSSTAGERNFVVRTLELNRTV